MEHKSFKERFFNKKTVLIVIIAVMLIGAGTGAAVLKASENPSFCNTCHIMKPYYESWHDSDLLAAKHAEADVDCHQCHEATISTQVSEGVKYVTGSYKTPLDKREFKRDFCLECHSEQGEGASWEEIKTATNFEESNPHDSHNGEQECNLCHNMHQPSKAMCSECHIFDWIDELDAGWAQE